MLMVGEIPAFPLVGDVVPIPFAASARDALASELLPSTTSTCPTLAPTECTSDPAATLADVTQAGQYFLQNETVTVARPTEAGPGTVEASRANSIGHKEGRRSKRHTSHPIGPEPSSQPQVRRGALSVCCGSRARR